MDDFEKMEERRKVVFDYVDKDINEVLLLCMWGSRMSKECE